MNTKTASFAGEIRIDPTGETESKGVSATTRRQLASRDLLGGGNELQIEHKGEIYTLRQTSKGKLILTK